MSDFWLRAVGGEDYVASVHAANTRQKIIADTKVALKNVLAASLSTSRTHALITDSDAESVPLCNAIEAAFKHGFKAKVNGRSNSIWNYIEQLPKSMTKIHEGFEVIRSLSEVTTSDGRAKAWIRRALNECELPAALEALVQNRELTRANYEDFGLFGHFEDATVFLVLIGGLDHMNFRLSFNESIFDSSDIVAKTVAPVKTPAKKIRKAKTKQVMLEDDNGDSLSPRTPTSEKNSLSRSNENTPRTSDKVQNQSSPSESRGDRASSFDSPSSSLPSSPSSEERNGSSPKAEPEARQIEKAGSPILKTSNDLPYVNGQTKHEEIKSDISSTLSSSPSPNVESKSEDIIPERSPTISPISSSSLPVAPSLNIAPSSPIQSSPVDSVPLPSTKNDPPLEEPQQSSENRSASPVSPHTDNITDVPFVGSPQVEYRIEEQAQNVQIQPSLPLQPQTEVLKETPNQIDLSSSPVDESIKDVAEISHANSHVNQTVSLPAEFLPNPFTQLSPEKEPQPVSSPSELSRSAFTQPFPPFLPQTESENRLPELNTQDFSSIEFVDVPIKQSSPFGDDYTVIPSASQIVGRSPETTPSPLEPEDPFTFQFQTNPRTAFEPVKARQDYSEENPVKMTSELDSQDSLLARDSISLEDSAFAVDLTDPVEIPHEEDLPVSPATTFGMNPSSKTETPPKSSASPLENSPVQFPLLQTNESPVRSAATQKESPLSRYAQPSFLEEEYTASIRARYSDDGVKFSPNLYSSQPLTPVMQSSYSSFGADSPPPQEPEVEIKRPISRSDTENQVLRSFSLEKESEVHKIARSTSSPVDIGKVPNQTSNNNNNNSSKKVNNQGSISLNKSQASVPTSSSPQAQAQPQTKWNSTVSVLRGALSRSTSKNNNNNSSQQPDGWTPPRKRVYFNLHANATLKDQDYRCAGCGVNFPMGLFSTVRYCEYSGKYYCGKCHKKETFFIPARILHNWDHRSLPVSTFSKQFLVSVYKEPLFDVSAINPKLYSISKTLPRIRVLRKQLFFLKDFILTCRDRSGLGKPLQDKMYLATDIHVYSLRDLVESHELLEYLRELVESYFVHIKQCELCKARGSVCEFCKSPKLVFPFELAKAVQCTGACHGIYHRACYVKEKCPKCIRIAKRTLLNSLPPSHQQYILNEKQ